MNGAYVSSMDGILPLPRCYVKQNWANFGLTRMIHRRVGRGRLENRCVTGERSGECRIPACGLSAGVPALAVFVVDYGKPVPASLSHPANLPLRAGSPFLEIVPEAVFRPFQQALPDVVVGAERFMLGS